MTNLKVMVMVLATACGSVIDPASHRQAVTQMLGQALAVKQPDGLPESDQPAQPRAAEARPAPKLQPELPWGD